MQSQKWQNDICSLPRHPFNITVIQVYTPTSSAEEAEVEQFHDDLLELPHKKRCPFHYRGLEWKSRKSRNTWSKRQIWPWSTERSKGKANKVLPREHTGHSKHPLPKTQEKTLHMDVTGWSMMELYGKGQWGFELWVSWSAHEEYKDLLLWDLYDLVTYWLCGADWR